MIRELGLWTLREACLQGKQWLEDGLEFGRIAVNVSANQIHEEDFADKVIQILNEVGFPSTRLELELTESCVMQVPEVSIGHLSKLRTLGINISIDDFGTGYSSLSYLKRLPIDKLKIDRSFVMDLATDANNMAITAAVISMGHAMGLNIIAEGVETEEQADYLKFKYCDEVQGYFYSKPLEVTNFVEFVADWEQRQSLEKLLPRDENKFL